MIATSTLRTALGYVLIAIGIVAPNSAIAMNDPVTGRWLQRDPAGKKDGANLYQFVVSNPTRAGPPERVQNVESPPP